jgi:hypothetical protein
VNLADRLLQPKFAWKAIKRLFWRLVVILRPFDNVENDSRVGQYAHTRWLNTLVGCRGWSARNGKLVYFEN